MLPCCPCYPWLEIQLSVLSVAYKLSAVMFATASLAARIERAECTMLMELARAAAARLGRGEVVVAPIAGGVAVHTGPGSPANKLAGLGFGDLPPSADLEVIEEAFALRHAPLQVEFASLGYSVIPQMLSRRGYELIGFENVLGLPLDVARLEDVTDGPISRPTRRSRRNPDVDGCGRDGFPLSRRV